MCYTLSGKKDTKWKNLKEETVPFILQVNGGGGFRSLIKSGSMPLKLITRMAPLEPKLESSLSLHFLLFIWMGEGKGDSGV